MWAIMSGRFIGGEDNFLEQAGMAFGYGRREIPNLSEQALLAARARPGPIERRESRLAYGFLVPTIASVLAIVLLPLAANFWISVKPVELADLRAAKPLVRERVSGEFVTPGDVVTVEYRMRSSSPKYPVNQVELTDEIPAGLRVVELDPRCAVTGAALRCEIESLVPRERVSIGVSLRAESTYFQADPVAPKATAPIATGDSFNVLTSFEFTWENFRQVFDAREFWGVLWVSLIYTFGGTAGALLLGLFAAQLLNQAFPGRAVLRGLFLFPYVAPVIAVAFTWVYVLDPFSGALNAMLLSVGATEAPINFLGQRGLALATVIAFESWRYFPLAFLFILARMQSFSADLNEAAEMDGATPLQQFWYIELPQLIGIVSTLFLLRFIWTFNKFDDIFLLTGGASGTRTFTVNVYEQAFALSNLGAGAAVSVVIFAILAGFATIYLRYAPREAGM